MKEYMRTRMFYTWTCQT